MRKRKTPDKVKKDHIRYVLVDKNTNKANIYHYKKDVAEIIGVSTKTLTRAEGDDRCYETKNYIFYPILEVFM